MSTGSWFKITNAALDRAAHVGPVAFAVYCVLAHHANAKGISWPSVPRIAAKIGTTERSARRALRTLELHGMIQTQYRCDESGRNSSSTYKLLTLPPRGQADTNDGGPGQKRQGDGDKSATRDGDRNDGGMGTQAPGELDPCEQDPIEPNSANKNRRALRFDPADQETAKWMFSLIRAIDQKAKQPSIDKWANDIRLMRESDNRTAEEIRAVFQWANANGFWKSNILSPSKLRDKFTTLQTQMKQGASRNGKPKNRHADSGVYRPGQVVTAII